MFRMLKGLAAPAMILGFFAWGNSISVLHSNSLVNVFFEAWLLWLL